MPRAQQMHLMPLSRLIPESIAYIREHEPPEGYFVGFSGGKDSIVTLELVRSLWLVSGRCGRERRNE